MIKQAILQEVKTELIVQTVETPILKENDVYIELVAAALNRRDYWITQGMYPGMQLPCALGSDGAGTIQAIGSAVKNLSIGDEIVINPGNNWGDDQKVQSDAFTVLGMPASGTHASHIVIAADRVHRKPQYLSWNEAAALPLAYTTAYRALMYQGELKKSQKVLISGIGGGVALAALQIAQAAGADVLVTTSQKSKGEQAVEYGAIAWYDYTDDSWSKNLMKTHGAVDLFIDGSGGANVNAAIAICRPGGRMVMYGATAGAPQKMDVFKLFWKQIHVIGTSMGSDQDFVDMLAFVEKHQLRPVIDHVYQLNDINDAYAQQAHTDRMGKIVINCSQ